MRAPNGPKFRVTMTQSERADGIQSVRKNMHYEKSHAEGPVREPTVGYMAQFLIKITGAEQGLSLSLNVLNR